MTGTSWRGLRALAAPARLPWLLALLLALALLGPAQPLRVRIDLLVHDLVSTLASARLPGQAIDPQTAPRGRSSSPSTMPACKPWAPGPGRGRCMRS